MKINLGSGPQKGINGWINIDQKKGADISIDITKGLPFPSDTINTIYTSHFLEHLCYNDICVVLKECFRVLIVGGEILVSVPDSMKFIKAYIQKDYRKVTLGNSHMIVPSFLISANEGIYSKALIDTGCAIDWINYIAYSNSEHKYMFDEENLLAHLKIAGFRKQRLREFDFSIDKLYRQQASLYAVAYK